MRKDRHNLSVIRSNLMNDLLINYLSTKVITANHYFILKII